MREKGDLSALLPKRALVKMSNFASFTARWAHPFKTPEPFGLELEPIFLRKYHESGLPFYRWVCVIGIVAYIAFFILHLFSVKNEGLQSDFPQIIRTCNITFLSAVLWLTFKYKALVLKHYSVIASFTIFIVLHATAYLALSYKNPPSEFYWSASSSIMFAVFIAYGFTRIPLVISAFITLSASIALLIYIHISLGYSPSLFSRMILHLVMTNIAGFILGRVIEISERANFFERHRFEVASEQLRQQTEALAASNAAKTRLIAAVAHDLRQPMTALMAHWGVLQRQADSSAIAGIAECIKAMDHHIVQLADLSRLQSSQSWLPVEPVDLYEVVEHIRLGYQALLQQTGVKLHFSRCIPGQYRMLSDKKILSGAISELITNAIKYRRPQYPRACVLVRIYRQGGQVHICVHDNGLGIAPEHQPHIFDEYYQVAPSRNRHAGQGIGLSVVRASMQRLPHHHLHYTSTAGRGSTFCLEAPQTQALQAEPFLPQATISGSLGGLFVLLIEDDELVSSALLELLQSWQIRVVTADRFAQIPEACQQAERYFDMIISDWALDGLHSGIDAITLARHMTAADTPALLISGNTDIQSLQPHLDSLTHFLAKPLKPEELFRVLQKMAQQPRMDNV